MTDTKYNETRKTAAKAVKNLIAQSPEGVSISAIRILVVENYGIGGGWVDKYLKDLYIAGYIDITFDKGKMALLHPRGKI